MNVFTSLLAFTLAGQSGFGLMVQAGTVVSVKSADRIVVRATFIEAQGRNVEHTFEAQIYAVKSPHKGDAGYAQSLAWAKKQFPVGRVVDGRTFGALKPGVLTQLVVMEDGHAKDIFVMLLEKGMGRISDANIPALVRAESVGFRTWKTTYFGVQAKAQMDHAGLWSTAWKKGK